MNNKKLVLVMLVFVLALSLGFIGCSKGRDNIAPSITESSESDVESTEVEASLQASPYVRWEYNAISISNLATREIIVRANSLGEEGWELITEASCNGEWNSWQILIFKRKLP